MIRDSFRVAIRFSLAAVCALLTYILGPLHAVPGQDPPEPGPGISKALSRMMLPGTQDLQLVIRLSAPSVIEWMRAGEGGQAAAPRPNMLGERSRMNPQSPQARGYRGQIFSIQRDLIRNLTSLP